MTVIPSGVPRILHIHGSLAADNPQAARCVRLIEAFGARLRHTLVAADGDFGALASVSKGVPIERKVDFPNFSGVPLPGRLQAVAQAMVDYHLVLTYGRAGIGAALAHTAFGEVHALPPLIHHEDGSDETPAQRGSMRSKWLRRLALGKAVGLVVPTETMEEIALTDWQQPMGRVKLIPDGVDLERFAKRPKSNAIGRLLKRDGEHWVGCFAWHAEPSRILALIAELAAVDDSWHLVIVGEPSQRGAIETAASGHALDHRVHFVPAASNPAEVIALFDIFAVVGAAEFVPVESLQAMAAGKPVLGLDPREAALVLAPDNAALDGGLARLAGDLFLRQRIGAANAEHARAHRGDVAMMASFRRLYASAMGRPTI